MSKSLFGLSLAELECLELGGTATPPYLARQLFHHLYSRDVQDFSAMSDVALQLRKQLADRYSLAWLEPSRQEQSIDGTYKFLFPTLPLPIEAVLIPNSYGKHTLCVSTQIGCRWGCRFCHTGDMGFIRHLSVAEILNQVRVLRQKFAVDHLVFMGMGEPLDNPATLPALELLHAGMGFGARRITLSTVGLLPEFDKFFKLATPFRLALSVHNPFSEERAQLIPAELVYPLEEVFEELSQYKKQRRLTFEYTLVKGYNDEPRHALALAEQSKRLGARVNLLRCHTHVEGSYYPPSNNVVHRFQKILRDQGTLCTLRRSRGYDINAACGSLITRKKDVCGEK